MVKNKSKILILAAHADDEVLGVGGMISKHVENGDEVYVCVVTKGYMPQWPEEYISNKIIEQEKVDNLLGIKRRFNLDFPTIKLNTIPSGELNGAVTEIVDKVKPNIVYTHYEHDLNNDHGHVFQAGQVATRPPKNIKLICYEILSETEWNNKPFQPNLWVDIEKHLNKKIKAFSLYKSELKEYPHPRSLDGIEILARKRGIEVCKKFAEAFIVIRDIC